MEKLLTQWPTRWPVEANRAAPATRPKLAGRVRIRDSLIGEFGVV
jgi:hypothetical protein